MPLTTAPDGAPAAARFTVLYTRTDQPGVEVTATRTATGEDAIDLAAALTLRSHIATVTIREV